MKIKVGIFFGGPSREREVSFAGGRTVYDNLNKTIFEPVPIFVDSLKNFIKLDWAYVYKGTIRDFYPPITNVPPSPNGFQIYLESLGPLSTEEQDEIIAQVGQRVSPNQLKDEIQLAFLALHGAYGEDGQIQEELGELGIPYTGSGVQASQIGMDKAIQKDLMAAKGFATPELIKIRRHEWELSDGKADFETAEEKIGYPMVIRPAKQGSSIGVSIIEEEDFTTFKTAVNQAFFREMLPVKDWLAREPYERTDYIRLLSDIRDGLGFPIDVHVQRDRITTYHPEDLLKLLNEVSQKPEIHDSTLVLESHMDEDTVIVESFIKGKEFSCIVIRLESGEVVALPPTEIIKQKGLFDYRAKYMPGFSRKITPIDLPNEQIETIRTACEKLFTELNFQTYARIDGFSTPSGEVFLNDPNTTSGMLPSSFFFHQAAEIGLNPSQFLTYIIRISVQERIKEQPNNSDYPLLLKQIDSAIGFLQQSAVTKRKIAIILGGYSFERHISVESGRNIFEKLASSEKYKPIPVFLTGNKQQHQLYEIPINLLLKDNADDIRDKIESKQEQHLIIETIKEACRGITDKYASKDVLFYATHLDYEQLKDRVDGVFIALHGRPGEDGQIQMELEARNLPYNGSGIRSSKITINKYKTLQTLKRNNFVVTEQLLMSQDDYQSDPNEFFGRIERRFNYPFVLKPVDDGCSSAVMVIKNRQQLEAYSRLIFRPPFSEGEETRRALKIGQKEEFPRKTEILCEQLIVAEGASKFLEITGGLLTHYQEDGTLTYEVFEPSETLATKGILSLEEKFLAGEGQNITPARFSSNKADYEIISAQVRKTLEQAARILDIRGYARIDAFVRIYNDNRAETIIVEVNSLPGMTPATVIFHQAALNKYKPYEFIDKIIEFGFDRQKKALHTTDVPSNVVKAAPVGFMPIQDTPPVEQNIQEQNMKDTDTKTEPQNIPDIDNSFKGRLMNFLGFVLGFLKSSVFIKNCLAIALVVVFLFFGLVTWLNWYTQHDRTKTVHQYIGMHIDDAQELAQKSTFEIIVNDSIFVVGKNASVVLDQTPKADTEVKRKRRIYVTITSNTPPFIPLPKLVGNYDYTQYTRKLERLGINYKIKERVFDYKQEPNTIQYFFHGSEKITERSLNNGVKVPKGSLLEFVVTERNTGKVPIPNLVCQRFKAAKFTLESIDLLVESLGPESDDAYVQRQRPAYSPGKEIAIGSTITLYLTPERPLGCAQDNAPSNLVPSTEQDTTSN